MSDRKNSKHINLKHNPFGFSIKRRFAHKYLPCHPSQDSVKRYILEQEGKKVFDYDIYNCPEHLKGQLTLGDFSA